MAHCCRWPAGALGLPTAAACSGRTGGKGGGRGGEGRTNAETGWKGTEVMVITNIEEDNRLPLTVLASEAHDIVWANLQQFENWLHSHQLTNFN